MYLNSFEEFLRDNWLMLSVIFFSCKSYLSDIESIMDNIEDRGFMKWANISIDFKYLFCNLRIGEPFFSELEYCFHYFRFLRVYYYSFMSFSDSYILISIWSFSEVLSTFRTSNHLVSDVNCSIFIIHL